MVKYMTKFHKYHLGVGICMNVCVCVCAEFLQDFEFWEGGNSKFDVDVEGVYST